MLKKKVMKLEYDIKYKNELLNNMQDQQTQGDGNDILIKNQLKLREDENNDLKR